MPENNAQSLKVARCAGMDAQRATLPKTDATIGATNAQPASLKALSLLVLERNLTRNHHATVAENPRNFYPEKTPEKLREVAREIQPDYSTEPMLATRCQAPAQTEIQQVLRWLIWIGETDRQIIAEVLNKCRNDQQALNYCLSRAKEIPEADKFDDRFTCSLCSHLSTTTGRCVVAGLPIMARENTVRGYRPHQTILRRCDGFKPP